MYRVELKDNLSQLFKFFISIVPNVPCGVESCQVRQKSVLLFHQFLMYRVELKGGCVGSNVWVAVIVVPNVPCGVERQFV